MNPVKIIRSVRALSIAALLALSLGQGSVWAAATNKVIEQLATRYPGARIELRGPVRMIGQGQIDAVAQVSLIGEDGQGQARISATGADGITSDAIVSFVAWQPAWIAKKRIHPGEKVLSADLVRQDVDVSRGMARELRGIILATDQEMGSLEARQTLLEGQFLTTSSVQKVPDIKRGEQVRIRMLSGGITLNTLGTAVEPGYLEQPMRVLTQRGKRDLVGRLAKDGYVEVEL